MRREFTVVDKFLMEIDHALRTSFAGSSHSGRPFPAADVAEAPLSAEDASKSTQLMRVNHTGEIAAQALYRGQAFVSQTESQRAILLQAATEEQDHLSWCQQRLMELNGRPSYLAPVWYAGSFAIGLGAGLAGDRWSLGFVEETEVQVSAHLDKHMTSLPEQDARSKVVLQQMREDEQEHADSANAAGAAQLPDPIKKLMTAVAGIMKLVSAKV